MTDYFALLGEPRRPWIDAEALKARFFSLSAESHPDHVHAASPAAQEAANRRSAELNTAHRTLRDPKLRLLHLLELELGRRPAGIEQAPGDMMNLFLQVGQLCRDADQHNQARAQAVSPMLKVKFFERGLELTGGLRQLQEAIRGQLAVLETELKGLNSAWEMAPAKGQAERAGSLPLARLEQIARAWSFASRWLEQLQERFVQLAL